MLNELTIENVAVIEKACVQFGRGLNVLTGETGAGKSILIGSINAILGNRASRDLVRNGASKAAIWASFSDLPVAARKQLAEAGYEAEDELLLYREIGLDGKTSCRINGRPATATILRELSGELINIHGQHDNQTLLCPEKHLSVLDGFAQNEALRADYYKSYAVLRDLVRQIKALSMDDGEKQRRLDLLRYEVEEIDAAALTDGEEETLLEQRARIRNAQKIIDALNSSYTALQGEEEERGGVDLLGDAMRSIEEISSFASEYQAAGEKLGELYYSAQEIALNIKEALDDFEFDPDTLDEIETRLDLIYKLKRKYGTSVAEILAYGEKSRAELETITFSEEKLEQLMAQRADIFAEAKKKAVALTENRTQAFARFAAQITESLDFLNMPGIVLELHREEGKLGPTGHDLVEFLISTNAGEAPKPLAKIASGGELSRIMLAIKSAMADKDQIGTIIYDEIDTGVSGLAAGRIGKKLKETSKGHQIICVTHTAQIAAQADRHLLIQKSVSEHRTFTEIHPLPEEGRVRELARIISGDQITELALANAKEMLAMANA